MILQSHQHHLIVFFASQLHDIVPIQPLIILFFLTTLKILNTIFLLLYNNILYLVLFQCFMSFYRLIQWQ